MFKDKIFSAVIAIGLLLQGFNSAKGSEEKFEEGTKIGWSALSPDINFLIINLLDIECVKNTRLVSKDFEGMGYEILSRKWFMKPKNAEDLAIILQRGALKLDLSKLKVQDFLAKTFVNPKEHKTYMLRELRFVKPELKQSETDDFVNLIANFNFNEFPNLETFTFCYAPVKSVTACGIIKNVFQLPELKKLCLDSFYMDDAVIKTILENQYVELSLFSNS